MLRGHVDLITASFVTGWAIDTDQPNKPVEVCLFVEGRKIAQILCNQLRPELRSKPGFGDGKHVFRFSRVPPLSSSMPTRVTVRHATTGRILGNGDAVLNGDGHELPPDLGADLPPDSLRISAPATSRQMFMSLLLYDRRQGLYNLLRQMDFTASSVETLLTATFDEVTPPVIEALATSDPAALRDMLSEMLLSEEFRRSILRLFLGAFPEKRRLLFVHIPKCAGSDLAAHLVSRYANISERLRTPHWINDRNMFEILSTTVRQLHFCDSILVTGHINLADYLSQGLVRPTDHVFTILRDPIDIAISQVNYILTRLKSDASHGKYQPDTDVWLRVLDLEKVSGDLSDPFLLDLGMRALLDRNVVLPNTMCDWLGGGDATTVLARLAQNQVEVTNTQNYPQWRRQRWGVEAETRRNESTRFLTRDNIGADKVAYLHDLSREDAKLYRTVGSILSKTGECSVERWTDRTDAASRHSSVPASARPQNGGTSGKAAEHKRSLQQTN